MGLVVHLVVVVVALQVISDLFSDKYGTLYNSVSYNNYELDRLSADIDSHIDIGCSTDENGDEAMSGSYSYQLPNGSIATINYVADALGFRVESTLLPDAVAAENPVPAHVQEQIDFANAQQAAGL
ncbi:unnamed protein product, partial [Meganyctiphanes norvegica]